MHPDLLALLAADHRQHLETEAARHNRAREARRHRALWHWQLRSPIVRIPSPTPRKPRTTPAALCQ
jgi:hypothetical protein